MLRAHHSTWPGRTCRPPGVTREGLPYAPGPRPRDSGHDQAHTAGVDTVQEDRIRQIGGWSGAASSLALLVSVPISLSGGVMSRPGIVSSGPDFWAAFFVSGFALSGGVLIHLRPRNPIGWLLVVSGLLQVTNIAADAYATRALTDPDGSLPAGVAMAWLASWTWMPSLLLPTLVLPALYPTGSPPNRLWRWHVRLALLGIALGIVGMATASGGLDDTVEGTELSWTAPTWTSYVLGLSAAALLIPTALTATLGTLVRAVRATSPERQQLLWLISVVAGLLATVFTGPEIVFILSYTLIPVAVAIGVLRYRLLGIEVALRRTLLYVPLTLLVALVVGGLTTVLARLAPQGPLPLLASSAVVAVLVIPVAGRLRVLVDRFVLGERDPWTLVDRVGAGLETQHDDPVASMLEAVASAADASYAAVLDRDGHAIAQLGRPDRPPVELPLRHGGADLGTLVIGSGRGETRLGERERRLAAALAPHLAVVVRSHLLTMELARERTRVTTATLAERDRLRRDLHDGLGPSLSGIALGLEAAARAHRADPESVPAMLTRIREEADAAVREIRRVLDGLRPSTLDLQGLEGAVRETASSLGLDRAGSPGFDLRAVSLPHLPPRVEEAAFRIVAESLNNVVRHSAADHCAVDLHKSNGDLRVRVSDDGCGPHPGSGTGHGLDSMRRRAADIGGSLRVESGEPRGTVVTALLPLSAR